MTDQERKAALEALDRLEKAFKGETRIDESPLAGIRDIGTIRAALTPSPMDGDVREAIEHFSVEIAAGKWDRDDGREFLETLIRAATAQSASPYKDYTWEDVAMLVQENRALKEAATAQKCEEVARKCKGCGIDISHKHPNAKFHSQECKDKYWNEVNPRGFGSIYEDDDDMYCDDDLSWDAHKSC